VNIAIPSDGLTPADYANLVWHDLAAEIVAHLRRDGLPIPETLDEHGLAGGTRPRCIEDRERLLTDPPFISVIIPTRDRSAMLATALDSLLSCDYPRFEVVVVDNAPRTDSTRDLLEDRYRGVPHVRYVCESRPGTSAARTRGVVEAAGHIVAFTDDDVRVDRFWLDGLATGFRATENVGCVTGLTLPLELETPSQLWFEQFGGFAHGFGEVIYDLDKHRSDNPVYPFNTGSFGAGNNMAFDKSVLAAIGGFDFVLGPATPIRAGEDGDLFLRVLTQGFRLLYQPAAIVHHRHRRDYAGLKRQLYSYGMGQTGVLTRAILHQPHLVPEFVRRLPAGLHRALSPSSELNSEKKDGYPGELTHSYLRGIAVGPFAYLFSWMWWHTVGRRTADRAARDPGVATMQETAARSGT